MADKQDWPLSLQNICITNVMQFAMIGTEYSVPIKSLV